METRSSHPTDPSPIPALGSRYRNIQADAARLLIDKISQECESYCILTGYDYLPEKFESDIDFMVGRRDFDRVPGLIHQIAEATGASLFLSTPHEVSARAYLLAVRQNDRLVLIQPDSTSDYRHFGRLWLRAEEMLANRRWHPNGFWIPSAPYEFIYYLIKRLSKRSFDPSHGRRLSRLYAEGPQACDALLARFWNKQNRRRLAQMAASGAWDPLIQSIEIFRRDLFRHRAETVAERIESSASTIHHTINRIRQPTGGWIAFMGPDGCGKSSVIEKIAEEFSPAFREIARFHLRPKFLRALGTKQSDIVNPHGRPPQGYFMSIAKALYMAVDYTAGYFIRIKPQTVRTKLVLFDRYFYDILVDRKRVRYGGPAWLPAFITKIIPQPEMTILLDAPPEVLRSRKQEVAFEEISRQREAYRNLAGKLRSAVVIDASQPLESVVHDVAEAILSHFSARTASRLGLDAQSADGPNQIINREH